MVKSATFEAKRPIGIGLRPSLWERIDRWAEAQGKSRNQVVEEILAAHIPVLPDFRKSGVEPQPSENGAAVASQEEFE